MTQPRLWNDADREATPNWFCCAVCGRKPSRTRAAPGEPRLYFTNEPGWQKHTIPGRNPQFWCPDHNPGDKR